MILPISAYGLPVLKAKAKDIEASYPGLTNLIENMYETMYNASGVGLAAPQIGLPIRLFITDGAAFDDDEVRDFKQVFINAKMITEEDELWKFNEGCLSIPGIREDVERNAVITISYFDEHFKPHTKRYSGLSARIIQHEYDHIEGVLFTDRLSVLRKRLLRNRLLDISKGIVDVEYKMKFPTRK